MRYVFPEDDNCQRSSCRKLGHRSSATQRIDPLNQKIAAIFKPCTKGWVNDPVPQIFMQTVLILCSDEWYP